MGPKGPNIAAEDCSPIFLVTLISEKSLENVCLLRKCVISSQKLFFIFIEMKGDLTLAKKQEIAVTITFDGKDSKDLSMLRNIVNAKIGLQ